MASKALVVGSGAIGLRTALELLRRDVKVHLRSPYPPLDPRTCSMGAGGLWMPFHCDDKRTDQWALETLDELLTVAKTESMVEIVPAVNLLREHSGPSVENFISDDGTYKPLSHLNSKLPEWTFDPRLSFQHLTVEMLSWQNKVHKLRIPSEAELIKAGYKHAWFFLPPIVDPPRMLSKMLSEIENHSMTESVDVNTGREYESMDEVIDDAIELGCDAIVNCTGLGSTLLCDDNDLIGARGILHQYDRKTVQRRPEIGEENVNDAVITVEEAPWGSETNPCYMIPRGDILVVGGTYLEGDKLQEFREEEEAKLKLNAWNVGIDTTTSNPVDKWTGFRPYRPEVRLEIDHTHKMKDKIKIVHNYGHGGSGWTVFIGAAKSAASLVSENV